MTVMKVKKTRLIDEDSEHENVNKNFFWRAGGQFYAYQSSVPDDVHPDEN